MQSILRQQINEESNVCQQNYSGITLHTINVILLLQNVFYSNSLTYRLSQDISRGISCHSVILFRLYYDTKECAFTVYAGGTLETLATLLINLFCSRAKRKRVISTECRCAVPAFIRREKTEWAYLQNVYSRFGFSHIYANQSISANSGVSVLTLRVTVVPFVL